MDDPTRSRFPRVMTWLVVPAILGVLVLGQAWLFRASTCETYDEFTYLRLGYSIYRMGNISNLASPMCPPLPILLEYWLPALRAKEYPGTVAWEYEVPGLIRQARLMTSALIGLPMAWMIHGWLARRQGWAIGFLGGGLVALSPTVVAACSIATTDACFALFALIALMAIHRYQVRPSRRSFLRVGVAIGLALAAKQSAVILFPVMLVEMLGRWPARKEGWTRVDLGLRRLWWLSTRMASLVFLAFLVDWACYGFRWAPRFGLMGTHAKIPEIIPMVANLLPNGEAIMEVLHGWGPPLAIDTFVGQMDHASEGHGAFLMGQHSYRGWWYFFPIAIAIKSTPAELVMLGLVVFQAFRAGSWRDPARRLWLVAVAVMLGSGMASSLNIGQRYMLLIYPLMVLIVADWLGEMAGRRPARVLVAGIGLLAWQAASVVGIAPQYLSYFNSFCGGPSQGYRYLVDSSLDWGQDLPSLRRELEAREYQEVALCYFGTAKPFAYEIRAVDWLSDDASVARCDWLAISATTLQGAYGGSSKIHERFRDLPVARVGYSIFLYDLKDPRVRSAWEEFRRARWEGVVTGATPEIPAIGPAAPGR